MIKIGITGSLASGKTTASKMLSFKRGPLFSADKAVKELYQNKNFKSLIGKRFKIKNFDVIINATSLGLKNGDDFNFNFVNTKKELIYIDTIYNPLETKTFKYLREEGRRVFNGLDMFIYQGQKSFYLWNKVNPEIDDGLVELLNSKLK